MRLVERFHPLYDNVILLDKACLQSWPEELKNLCLLGTRKGLESREIESVSDARGSGEEVECFWVEFFDLGDEHVQQRAKVEVEGLNLLPVKFPALFLKRKAEDVLVDKAHDELFDEERIAIGLLFDDLRETSGVFRLCVEHVGDHEVDAFAGQRADEEFAGSVGLTKTFHHQIEFVLGFIVANRGKEENGDLLEGDNLLEQFEGRRVGPLQVIKKQDHWRGLDRFLGAEDRSKLEGGK